MKYLFTDFYTDFECIGGECSHTCCGRWNIYIDDDTMRKYSELEEEQRNWICSHIVEQGQGEKKIIQLKEDGKCPFLNDCNLCEIYLKVSPDAISTTCQTYPRRIVNYYDVILATVSVSCPEVARMLICKKDAINFAYIENDDKADVTGADWILYNELINSLIITTDILQNRTLSIYERVYLVLQLTDQVQMHIEEGKIGSLRKNIECYKDASWCKIQLRKLDSTIGEKRGYWNFIHSMLNRAEKATSGKKNWAEWNEFLQKYVVLEKNAEEKFCDWNRRFKNVEIETEFENLAVEFIFEYYMDALEKKNLFFNVLKMVLLLILVKACEVVHYNVEGELPEADRVTIISTLSRIIEHSDLLEDYVRELTSNYEKSRLFEMAFFLE